MIVHRLDTVALLHSCFLFSALSRALDHIPNAFALAQACHKTDLHLTLWCVVPGHMCAVRHVSLLTLAVCCQSSVVCCHSSCSAAAVLFSVVACCCVLLLLFFFVGHQSLCGCRFPSLLCCLVCWFLPGGVFVAFMRLAACLLSWKSKRWR